MDYLTTLALQRYKLIKKFSDKDACEENLKKYLAEINGKMQEIIQADINRQVEEYE